MTKIDITAYYDNPKLVAQMKRGNEQLRALTGKIADAVSESLNCAVARLLADGVTADRLLFVSDTGGVAQTIHVDAQVVDGMITSAPACVVAIKLGNDLCYEVECVWHEPYAHLADCDPADDAAKIEAMWRLVT